MMKEHACLECHNSKELKGGIDLSIYEGILKVVRPGHVDKSLMVHAVEITPMPIAGNAPPLLPDDLKLVKDWISSGASQQSFKKISGVLSDYACLDCHTPPKPSGNIDLSTYESAMKYVSPGNPRESLLISSVEIKPMPLKKDVPHFHPEDRKLLKEWIESGAPKD